MGVGEQSVEHRLTVVETGQNDHGRRLTAVERKIDWILGLAITTLLAVVITRLNLPFHP